MKRTIPLLLALAMCLLLCACSGKTAIQETTQTDVALPQIAGTETTEPVEEKAETAGTSISGESEHCRLEGIYVDTSYANNDNASLKMVYVCYTVSTNNQNLRISSKSSELGFESGNTYSSETYSKSCCDYLPNYYSSDYLEDVYIGGSLKVVSTFLVPYAEFEIDGIITVRPYGIPYEEILTFSSKNVQFFDSADDLAQVVDPEGYAEIMALHEPADAQTCAKVKAAINGYYWSFYVNSTSYEIEFWAPSNFKVRVTINGFSNSGNSGTYTIQNGYIVCTYDGSGTTVEIPYSWGANDIDLNLTDAFDVRM